MKSLLIIRNLKKIDVVHPEFSVAGFRAGYVGDDYYILKSKEHGLFIEDRHGDIAKVRKVGDGIYKIEPCKKLSKYQRPCFFGFTFRSVLNMDPKWLTDLTKQIVHGLGLNFKWEN